jgi:hypothetical protein
MFASLDDLLLFDPTSINSVPIQLFVGLFDIHIVPGENNLHQTHKQQEQPPGLVLCGWLLFVCSKVMAVLHLQTGRKVVVRVPESKQSESVLERDQC